MSKIIPPSVGQEIQANGANVAPRITPADIEANIVSEHYFTAGDGIAGRCYREVSALHSPHALELLTFCVLVLRNGTKIVGINYGAIDPAQHSAQRGLEEARKHAIEQIWPLLGYELRSYIHAMKGPRTGPAEDLLAAINAEAGKVELVPSQDSGLQPIDTAPTDGTVFLGYRERDRRWGECYRVQRDDCEMWSFGCSSAAAEQFPDFKPTHWMPLPGEPKQMGILAIDSAVA